MKITKSLNRRISSLRPRRRDSDGWEHLTENEDTIFKNQRRNSSMRKMKEEDSEGFHSSRFRCSHYY